VKRTVVDFIFSLLTIHTFCASSFAGSLPNNNIERFKTAFRYLDDIALRRISQTLYGNQDRGVEDGEFCRQCLSSPTARSRRQGQSNFHSLPAPASASDANRKMLQALQGPTRGKATPSMILTSVVAQITCFCAVDRPGLFLRRCCSFPVAMPAFVFVL
jgi:hypothetical protein